VLLRTRDLTRSDQMELTEEFLAQMLGVHRSAVSVVAGTLQKAGFIKYSRGRIRLLDIVPIEARGLRMLPDREGYYGTATRHLNASRHVNF
jgi:hypothetical protein